MQRLFVFGCSFTNYWWPTWADLASLEYDYYENWGIPGIGNRGIAERIAECHAKNNFTECDTVIVQWSSHVRHDWYKNIYNKDEDKIEGWGVYYDSDSYTKNQKILDFTFSDKSYIINTMNMIILVQSLLNSTNCNWAMTSLGDLKNLGYDNLFSKKSDNSIESTVEQIVKNKKSSVLWEVFPELKFYEDIIWSKNQTKWINPIFDVVKKHKDKIWSFEKDNYIDFHPTPEQHNIWLEENLYKLIKPTKNLSEHRKYIVSKFNKLKESTNYSSEDFSDVSESLMNKLGKLKYPQLIKTNLGL